MSHIRLAGLAGLVGAAALLAACSSGGGAASPNTTPPATSAGTSNNSNSSSSSSTSTDLSTKQTSLGTVVVDSKGRTVYLFTVDTNNPPKSNCDTGCDSVWPPVPAPASGTPSVSGVDNSKVGVVTRSDGSKQLTLNGWPLYEYEGDSAPGDVKGENVQGTWFAVSPQGTKVTSTASTQIGGTQGSGSSGSGSSGYSSGSGGW